VGFIAQGHIFEYLKKQRQSGNPKYYSAMELRKLLLSEGINIEKGSLCKQINSLLRFNYLEAKTDLEKKEEFVGLFRVRTILKYRIRKEYCKQ
jgi:hypothetical protein